MNMEYDRKEGTDPDLPTKKRKTVTLDRKVIFGWWLFLVSVAGWMFYLGIIVGRESAPVYFDMPQLDSDLMSMISSAVNPESTDVVLPEATDTKDLEFFEALRENKGISKKIQEIDQSLQSKSKLAAAEAEKNGTTLNGRPVIGKSAIEQAPGDEEGIEEGPVETMAKPENKPDTKSDSKTVNKSAKTRLAEKSTVKNDKTVADASKKGQQKKDEVASPGKAKDPKKQDDVKKKMPEAIDKKAEKVASSSVASSDSKVSDQKKAQAKEAVKELNNKHLEKAKPEKTKETSKEIQKVKPESQPEKAEQEKSKPSKTEQAKSQKYTIQAGAVKTHEDAETVVKKLSASGINASIVKGKGSDGTEWFRIRIGSYAERDKAVKMAETIKGEGFPAMVINAP